MTSLDIMFILVIAVNIWNKNVITWMTVLPSKVCPVANFQTTIFAWVPSGHNWLISTMLSPVECTLMTFDHPPFVSGDFQQHFFSHNPCLAVYGAHLIYFHHFLKHTPLGSMHGFRGYTSAALRPYLDDISSSADTKYQEACIKCHGRMALTTPAN